MPAKSIHTLSKGVRMATTTALFRDTPMSQHLQAQELEDSQIEHVFRETILGPCTLNQVVDALSATVNAHKKLKRTKSGAEKLRGKLKAHMATLESANQRSAKGDKLNGKLPLDAFNECVA